MKLLSIDIETTSLDPNKGQILEFAAIYEDTDNPLSYEDSKKMHVIFKYDRIYGNPRAISMNSELIDVICGLNVEPQGSQLINFDKNLFDMMFCQFVSDCDLYNSKLTGLGKNLGSFDYRWLEHHTGIMDYFSHRSLDIGSLCSKREHNTIPNLENCLMAWDLHPTNLHSAVGDAWDCIRVLRKVWGYGD